MLFLAQTKGLLPRFGLMFNGKHRAQAGIGLVAKLK